MTRTAFHRPPTPWMVILAHIARPKKTVSLPERPQGRSPSFCPPPLGCLSPPRGEGGPLPPPGGVVRPDPVLDEAVEQALREVMLWDDLKDKLKQKATELHLEQQQKLCIARLLPLKPEIILMDEPCSALDIGATAAVEELMLTLAGKFTIVIVTHNMAQARRVSDECIFMLLGEIIEHDRTEQIFLSPKEKKTSDYIEGRYG